MSLIFIIIYIAFWCGLTGRSRKLLYFFFVCTKTFFFFHHQHHRGRERERKGKPSAFCICKVEKNHRGVSEGSFSMIISYVVYFIFYAMWPTQSHSLSHSSSAVCFARLISNVMSKSRFL